MSLHRAFLKTATAKRDYTIDWSVNAPGDGLTTVSWALAPSGLTTVFASASGGQATIRLAGGTLDGIYLVRATATRASGQVDTRSLQIVIVPRIVVVKAAQDPTAVIDYAPDLTHVFGTDAVQSYAWTVSGGLSIVGASTAPTVRLTGGAAGSVAYADCHLISVSGQEDDRSIELVLQDF